VMAKLLPRRRTKAAKAKPAKPVKMRSKPRKKTSERTPPKRPPAKRRRAKAVRYRFRINGEILAGFFTFPQAMGIMRAWPYDSKTEPSKRPLFEVLLPDGSVHYTDRRS